MSEKLLVSIIIPVYNVEKYLLACVNSVINQTYKCLEIILVDDGSTDSSGRICDECAKLDSRIKVIHKTNGGLSDARNAGIDAAIGDYLAFVDSDDIIHTRFIEMLYALANYLNADISSVEFKNFYDEETLDLEEILVGKTMILQSEEAIDKILYQ
ncbi:MAG: glycosyltransferase, partial [Muribaculaceae bacterium]|nr:glycosyltransferase [Muribaculaceae bacterium]